MKIRWKITDAGAAHVSTANNGTNQMLYHYRPPSGEPVRISRPRGRGPLIGQRFVVPQNSRPTPASVFLVFHSGSGMRKIVFQVIQYKPFQILVESFLAGRVARSPSVFHFRIRTSFQVLSIPLGLSRDKIWREKLFLCLVQIESKVHRSISICTN